jgi:hypothetical protein
MEFSTTFPEKSPLNFLFLIGCGGALRHRVIIQSCGLRRNTPFERQFCAGAPPFYTGGRAFDFQKAKEGRTNNVHPTFRERFQVP